MNVGARHPAVDFSRLHDHARATVVDIDSAADAQLQHAIDIYGDSPVIVRTASGKAHVYYRHGGERRRTGQTRAIP
jgi:hypothetical protein